MYIPKQFNVTDKKKILAFIKANSFGQLISLVEGKLFSSHIPFLLGNNDQSLLCHIAKNNPQWKNIEEQEVLITFQGPHDYVSPSWYSSPGVPTWNYQSVHVYGKPKIITEKDKIGKIVNELSTTHESSFEKPWKPEYKESMLNVIIGIEVEITNVQCKYKLSQNRPESDRLKVIEEHKNKGSIKLSQATENEL